MKIAKTLLFLVPLLSAVAFQNLSGTFSIDTELDTVNLAVKLQANIPDGTDVKEFILYRSTSYLQVLGDEELVKYPVTVIKIAAEKAGDVYTDKYAAHNTTYYYRARITDLKGHIAWSNISKVKIPDVRLNIDDPVSILVDKIHYILEIGNGTEVMKRYPVALGANPYDRKLHQDNATTPEGLYSIVRLQPEATYYKAYDINYPNDVDRARYVISKEKRRIKMRNGMIPSIGGSIQIHGMGIENNWTWGCIAMRNRDIDELFQNKHIAKGTIVAIFGQEVKRQEAGQWKDNHSEKMIRSVQEKLTKYNPGAIDGKFGFKTSLAIGRFQLEKGLPLTCDVDSATISEIFKQL